MVRKPGRHAKIRELLQAESVDTHSRLAALLARQGLVVSQSTLSKDLRELGVVRVPGPEGGFRYMPADATATLRDRRLLERELREYQVGMRPAGSLLILHTTAGHAQSVCEAIDRMGWPEIVGTIAGENTIFVATESAEQAEALGRRIATIQSAVA